jgi:hypothetical protein
MWSCIVHLIYQGRRAHPAEGYAAKTRKALDLLPPSHAKEAVAVVTGKVVKRKHRSAEPNIGNALEQPDTHHLTDVLVDVVCNFPRPLSCSSASSYPFLSNLVMPGNLWDSVLIGQEVQPKRDAKHRVMADALLDCSCFLLLSLTTGANKQHTKQNSGTSSVLLALREYALQLHQSMSYGDFIEYIVNGKRVVSGKTKRVRDRAT